MPDQQKKVYVLLGGEKDHSKPRVIYAGDSAYKCAIHYDKIMNENWRQILIEVWIDGYLSKEEDEELLRYL